MPERAKKYKPGGDEGPRNRPGTRSPSSIAASELINCKTWRRASKAFLRENFLCVDCKAQGRETLATEVHHEAAHRGDHEIFWDQTGWRALCKPCHSRRTARGE